MFNDRTTFILGAGASCPYGYPSGQDLVSRILTLDTTFLNNYTRTPESYAEQWRSFTTSLRRSHSPSIDAFLGLRREFAELGKLAIAHLLIECEDTDKLLATNDWYTLLVNKLGPALSHVPENQLTILTFNYDRSLEHFLFETLTARSAPGTLVGYKLAQLKIIHVYGSLGKLPWCDGSMPAREYGDSSADAVKEAAKGLRLIYEVEQDRQRQILIDSTLEASNRIYILGFGFHDENMQWLIKGLDRKNPVATFYGLTQAEAEAIRARFNIPIRDYSNNVVRDFLRNDPVFAAT